ncbi:hypothetical protein C5F63_13395 [Photobacterium damselae subsp. damselae]|uniref:hypothetical protein n=1 Tax=Photobacterium damselae TaxID=38293 RepID=UPI000D06245B|nr:hypothetical protein [Photobacterium damselae]PSB86009.1 hypothetical protein C5F63_13395 [Photobacterium damselae subsp. damselae]
MIKYEFDIDDSYMDKFFSPIKNKIQIIELIMNSIKYMLLNPNVKKERSKGKIILKVDKMSRIFFIKSDKFFSVMFPFNIKKDEAYSFYFKNKMNIDNRITSETIALINEQSFYSGCSLDFAEKISTYQETSCNDDYWDFLRELLLMEDGYLRYDYDMDNYEKHKKSDIHPLNHYDLFYSSNATFKVGLKNKIKEDDFFDLLDIKTKCKFLI